MTLLSGRAVTVEPSLVSPVRAVCRSVHVLSHLERIFGGDVGLSAVMRGSLLHGCYMVGTLPAAAGGPCKLLTSDLLITSSSMNSSSPSTVALMRNGCPHETGPDGHEPYATATLRATLEA